jgi:hypothetical protein
MSTPRWCSVRARLLLRRSCSHAADERYADVGGAALKKAGKV